MKGLPMKKRNSVTAISGVMPAGLILLMLAGIRHLDDVRKGAAESTDFWLVRNYMVLLAAAMLLVLVAGVLLYAGRLNKTEWKPLRLEKIYLPVILGFGFLYLMVLPPLSAPDEVSHYISAYQLSNHLLGQAANYRTGHVLIREEDWFIEDIDGVYEYVIDEAGYLVTVSHEPGGEVADHASGDRAAARVHGQTLTEETYQTIHNKGILSGAETAIQGNGMAVSVYPPVVTTPLVYLPQALGISLARMLGFGSLGLLYLGRIFNLLAFAAVSHAAIRRMPFGKEVLFGVSLLPMSLHLIASLSYDSAIMAGIFLFAAQCFYLAFEKERVKAADILLLAVIMVVVGPCKMVYAVFMGLCLLIPVKKFGGWKWWALSAACVLGAWGIMMFAVNSQTIAVYAAETDSYVAWAEEAGFSLSMLLQNPRLLMKMFYNTIVWQAEYYHLTMIGAYLGNVDVILEIPYLMVLLFTGGLLGLAFRKPGETLLLTGGRRIWIWFLCVACTFALMLSMLIAWTPLSAVVIAGVQGRYFLPFLPVLLMSVKNDLIVLTKNADRSILYLMCCANAYILIRLFGIICLRIG